MGRTSAVSYETIEKIANDLYRQGNKNPSARDIRNFLKDTLPPNSPIGSQTTIQEKLNIWRLEARPADSDAPLPELPAILTTEITRLLQQTATSARESAEQQLAPVQADLDELTKKVAGYEYQISDQLQTLAQRTSERDIIAGQLKEVSEEAVTSKKALQREQALVENIRQELAAARFECKAAEARVADANSREDMLRSEVKSVRSELAAERALLAQERNALSDAKLRAEVADVRFHAEADAKRLADARIGELVKAVHSINGAASRAAAAEASTARLKEQVATLNDLLLKLVHKTQPINSNNEDWVNRAGSEVVAGECVAEAD